MLHTWRVSEGDKPSLRIPSAVSYTHLVKSHYGDEAVKYINEAIKDTPYLKKISEAAFEPVSYTHLDVYKRQESSGVLQRLIEGNDLTLYGLSNAVTRHSQDVPDYDRATALEGIGYNILSMPARQWSRINQLAA